MTSPPPAPGLDDPRRFRWAVAGVAAVGLLVRTVLIWLLPSQTIVDVGGDGFSYVSSAYELAHGQGFVTGRTIHPPLWTIVLGAARWVGLDNMAGMRSFTAVLGTVTVVLVALVGRRIASGRAGVVAAALATVYPGLWVYERNLNAEALLFVLIALSLLLAYRYLAAPRLWLALLLSLVIGCMAMTRSEQILAVPLLLVPLVLITAGLDWWRRLGRLALCGVVVLAVVSPWTIHNWGEFDRPLILSAGAGNAMLAATCDATFYGDRLGSYDVIACIYPQPSLNIEDPTSHDAAQRAEAIAYTKDHLGRYPVVVAARQGRTWGLYAQDQQAEQDRTHLNLPLGFSWGHLASFWVVGPLAVAGAVVLWRRKARLFPLLAYPAMVFISTTLTFGDARYRAPAEVSVVVLAGVALDAAWTWWRRRSVPATTGVEAAGEARPAGGPPPTATGPDGDPLVPVTAPSGPGG